MIKVTSEADRVCVAKAADAGQAHIFDGWEKLTPEAQRSFIRQIQSIDFQLVKHLVHQRAHGRGGTMFRTVLKPSRVDRLPTKTGDPERYEACLKAGEEALAGGKVGLVMSTNGGASADLLGEPTGFLPIGPVSGKTVFQLHAEKIRALNRRYKQSLRWWTVTSPDAHEQICDYFRRESYFGLNSSDTIFLPQPVLPLVDRRGKFLLSEPGRLAVESNGHGGVLLEILKPENLDGLKSKGIEHVFFFRVENPLVKVADPIFIGHHILSGVETSSKAIAKSRPEEEVGVFCQTGGTTGVVAFSELKEEDQKRTLQDGTLAFNHGNMAVHVFSVEFFERMVKENVELPFHTLARTASCVNKRGEKVRPTEPNCVGLRFFLFDALKVAKRVSIVEVDRENEFSPIYHAGGAQSALTAQRDLSRLYGSWLVNAGATFKNSGGVDGHVAVEICPLYALDEEELKSKIDLPLEIDQDLLIGGRS